MRIAALSASENYQGGLSQPSLAIGANRPN